MNLRIFRFLAIALLVTACNRPAGGDPLAAAPLSWIDRPLEGSRYLLGDTIPIVWHASGDDGVRSVEILIDGESFEIVDDLDPDLVLAQGESEWSDAEPGEHLVQVVATGPDDTVGVPAENRITVYAEGGSIGGATYSDLNHDGDADDAGEGPLEGVSVIVAECGEKRSVITGPDGVFQFDDLPMEDCVLDFDRQGWDFVETIPAGLDIPIHFTPDPASEIGLSILLAPEPTPVPTATATPTRTPTPLAIVTKPPVLPAATTIAPIDDVPPPKPQILSPDGAVLGCLDNIVLRWSEVDDSSGIDYYEVVLKVDTGGANFVTVATWQSEAFTAINVNDQTDCGNAYGWTVRARDNAGNWGQADAALFGIDLP